MCDCLKNLDERLAPQGLKLCDKNLTLVLPKKGPCYFIQTIPLVQLENGRKPKLAQPKSVGFTYCPFCGKKYGEISNPVNNSD
ncbi:hypothetical protein D082_13250 [Synechocystis sp. PCC 6714]|nr:hypothetical protein D082_13250 [Synechocystis sp. PCC 6714]